MNTNYFWRIIQSSWISLLFIVVIFLIVGNGVHSAILSAIFLLKIVLYSFRHSKILITDITRSTNTICIEYYFYSSFRKECFPAEELSIKLVRRMTLYEHYCLHITTRAKSIRQYDCFGWSKIKMEDAIRSVIIP